jgi:hypothetical protein
VDLLTPDPALADVCILDMTRPHPETSYACTLRARAGTASRALGALRSWQLVCYGARSAPTHGGRRALWQLAATTRLFRPLSPTAPSRFRQPAKALLGAVRWCAVCSVGTRALYCAGRIRGQGAGRGGQGWAGLLAGPGGWQECRSAGAQEGRRAGVQECRSSRRAGGQEQQEGRRAGAGLPTGAESRPGYYCSEEDRLPACGAGELMPVQGGHFARPVR